MPILGLLKLLYTFIKTQWLWLFGAFWILGEYVFNWLLNFGGQSVGWIASLFPSGWWAWASKSSLPASIFTHANEVNWIIPWKLCIGIYAFAMGISIIVRVGRWVIGGWQVAGTGVRA